MQAEKEFKYQEVNDFWNAFAPDAEKEIVAVVDARLRDLGRLLTSYKHRFEKLNEAVLGEPDNIKHFREFNSSLLELLTKYQGELSETDCKNPFGSYYELVERETTMLPQEVLRQERFTGYPLSKKDKLITLVRKGWLNSVYFGKFYSKKTGNFFRRIIKRPSVKLETYRLRHLPFFKMAQVYTLTQMTGELSRLLYDLLKGESIILHKIWKLDEEFDRQLQIAIAENDSDKLIEIFKNNKTLSLIDQLKGEVSELRKNIKKQASERMANVFSDFDKAMHLVDTPDLPLVRFHDSRLLAEREVKLRRLNTVCKQWANTQTTLFDDWAVDVEIVLLYYSVLSHATRLKQKINDFINQHLSVDFDQLGAYIKASAKTIEDNSHSASKLETALHSERGRVNEELIDAMLAEMIERLSGSFIDDLEVFRSKTMSLAAKVSNHRGFIRSKSYERDVRDSEINYISPRELLSFEAWPHFEQSIEDVKSLVRDSLEKVRLKMLAMGTVCDFSLESAIMLLEQKKNAAKGAMNVAIEGYDRALLHVDEAIALVEDIRKQPVEKLEKAIHEFNAEIQELKNTENIFELNIRIARIRAIERSKKMRRDAMLWLRNIVPGLFRQLQSHFNQTNRLVDNVKSMIGVTSEKKPISYEVSEFIRQTEVALQKLPFVYQRLYQIRPTDEDRFFVDRRNEFEMLEKAFTDWTLERFVVAAVLGEKGSGITSFLSYFKRKSGDDYPVIHHSPDYKIYKPEQYLQFFASILEVEKFDNNEAIISHINAFSEKKIIILENLQHVFLKMVNGLECQKMLFELMSNTAKKVFWIGTYTIHSWDYLDKAIHISDYFVREIRLDNMSSENLEAIIFKRNSLSGYKVRFEPPDDLQDSRSFAKMDDGQKQILLRNRYFADLTTLSNGNISLAQLYWLRSTREVTEDTISVGSIFAIDLSFVKKIKSDYLFALYTMLVHDGLTLSDYARLFYLSESSCRNILVPMLEKGMLIRPKEKFNINPIIYRQVVSYLRSRNFIS